MTTWEPQPDHPFIGLSRQGAAARIELRRPERLNALDEQGFHDLLTTVQRVAEDDSVRAVLITGSGRAFSAGADIGGLFADPGALALVEPNMRAVTKPTILALRSMPKPVVAAVNGAAAGVACGIALACDIVLAGESAYFLAAFANIGLTLDGGLSALIAARAGLGRALTMALLAERIPAAQALSWGLADRVVPDAELARTADELVLRLASGPTRSYAASKELINRTQLADLDGQLELEADLQGRLLASADFTNAVPAFGAKQAPTFEGR